MSDAIPAGAAADQITAIDLLKISVEPVASLINYTLRETWQSGKVSVRDGVVRPPDFAACVAAWAQATPKKKFLQFLVANGYENNMTPQ
jgi:hypothetical protein